MKQLVQNIAFTVVTLSLLGTPSLAEAAKADSKNSFRAKVEKRMNVRGPKQFRKALAKRQRQQQAVVISCKPVDSNWCNNGFVSGCAGAGGIGSSNPDGGHTCSFPDMD